MEAREDLTIFSDYDAERHRWRGARAHNGNSIRPAIAPDGRAMCWGREAHDEGLRRLTIDSLNGGLRTVEFEDAVPGILALSDGAQFLVAGDGGGVVRKRRRLEVFDLRSDVIVRDLSRSVTQFRLADLFSISVSGSGVFAVVGSWEQMQVLEIPTGKSVYAGPGFLPRMSPDGKRVAFVNKDRLYIRLLTEGTNAELLPRTRVKGIGGWSPDGRFLLAGAWTKLLAVEKRQIIIDTFTGDYGVLGTLQEGDYGEQPRWISSKLLAR